MKFKYLIAAAVLSVGLFVRAASVTISATADTTLDEFDPAFNMGGADLVAGSLRDLSEAETPAIRRALIRFDLGNNIPQGAVISAVQFNINLIKSPGVNPSTFELHRMLKDWGEGTKGGSFGAAASAGEANWVAPKSPSPLWGAPGAGDSTDRVGSASSSLFMDATGAYTFPSSLALVADVNGWRANPSSNFGWMLNSASENLAQSARRFASRSAGATGPTLTITYSLPPPEVRITQFQLTQAGMVLTWTGGSPKYRVERADDLAGPWTAVTPVSTDLSATAPVGATIGFYRIASQLP
jgi:hypothetical protein